MFKQSEQTASFCPGSSQDWSIHFREHPEHGLMSCQPCSGVCTLHQTVQLDSLPSSSYMALRQSFPLILSSNHLAKPCTRRQRPKKLDRMASIEKKKHASWPCPGRQYTNRSCTTTTARRSARSLFARVTWCSAESRNR